jgi:hypothetical protein
MPDSGLVTMTYDEAMAAQRRHEDRILGLPGVTAIGVKLRDGRPVLVTYVDPRVGIPAELGDRQIDGLDVVVEGRRYEAR